MDVLVQWKDGTKNVVDAKELQTEGCKEFKVENMVTIKYKKNIYKEFVLAVEQLDEVSNTDLEDNIHLEQLLRWSSFNKEEENKAMSSDSEDNVPLSKLAKLSMKPLDNTKLCNSKQVSNT